MPRPAVGVAPQWAAGDVAFLRRVEEFSPSDYAALMKPRRSEGRGHLQRGATGHPVIILAGTRTHVVATTVSAYGSGPENGYLAPWKQRRHQDKEPEDFRSFSGSERPNGRPFLRLEPGMSWPKRRTSWVNIQSVFVVPRTVLARFTRSREDLRVQSESLEDLRRRHH
ncbi:hypothetical protein VTK26DRAFT_789 [Humicola hyalothermophila]